MTIPVWRIGSETSKWKADDLSGGGAEAWGGRWNREGTPILYFSSSRALACLETMVHLNGGDLPLNRYLVELEIPQEDWVSREIFDPEAHARWDDEPPGRASMDWGTEWVAAKRALVAEVPSVIVKEEPNLLVNPLHPRAGDLVARIVRKWLYDPRLFV